MGGGVVSVCVCVRERERGDDRGEIGPPRSPRFPAGGRTSRKTTFDARRICGLHNTPNRSQSCCRRPKRDHTVANASHSFQHRDQSIFTR